MRKLHVVFAAGALFIAGSLSVAPAYSDEISGAEGSAPAVSASNETNTSGEAAHVFGVHDGKLITTAGHIDAPKVFWENGGFVLKNEAKGSLYPLENTANWVGKGFYRDGTNTHIFDTKGEARFDFLNATATRWYRAPRLPAPGNTPIWAGFGADSKIPVENFKDGAFWLELVGFEGPGRMEMFMVADTDVTRLISSHDPSYRSSLLNAGTHTHNETVFSKPGKYTLTYRAVARDKAGNLISSAPVPFNWYVGGVDPASMPDSPVNDRYNAAAEGNTDGYSFTVSPNQNPATNGEGKVRDGEEAFSTLRFDAKDTSAQGTLALFIDGYPLTEVPVKNGVGVHNEMLGSLASRLQAVFIPADAAHGRWVSPAVEYTPGNPAATVTGMADSWPSPTTSDPAPSFAQETYAPKDASYIITSVPDFEKQTVTTTIQFSDPKIRGAIRGGWTSDPKNPYYDIEVEGMVGTDGKYVQVLPMDWIWDQGFSLKINLIPTAYMVAEKVTIVTPWTLGNSQTASGKLYQGGKPAGAPGTENGSSADQGSDQGGKQEGTDQGTEQGGNQGTDQGGTQNGNQNAGQSGSEGTAKQCQPIGDGSLENPFSYPVLIRQGHLDISAHKSADGKAVQTLVRDDSNEHAKGSVYRTPSSINLAVPNIARKSTSILKKDSQWDILRQLGDSFFQLDEKQRGGMPWPGWSTQQLGTGSAKLHLEAADVPAGGRFILYQYDSVRSKFSLFADSGQGKNVIDIPDPTHTHAAWVFNKPGAYRINVYYELANGATSQPQALTFLVGDEAINSATFDCAQSGGNSNQSPGAGDAGTNQGGEAGTGDAGNGGDGAGSDENGQSGQNGNPGQPDGKRLSIDALVDVLNHHSQAGHSHEHGDGHDHGTHEHGGQSSEQSGQVDQQAGGEQNGSEQTDQSGDQTAPSTPAQQAKRLSLDDLIDLLNNRGHQH